MPHHSGSVQLYPFLFRVCSKNPECWMEFGGPAGPHDEHGSDIFYVYLCCFNYTYYDAKWACDPQIGNRPLRPDMDMVHEEHKFSNEGDAINFIKNWWKQQP